MDWAALGAAILVFIVPRNLSDVFIDSEATLFLPILVFLYRKVGRTRLQRAVMRWV